MKTENIDINREKNEIETIKFQTENDIRNIQAINDSLQTQIRILQQSLESTQNQYIDTRGERDILSMDIVKLNKEAIEMEKQLAKTKEMLDLKESQLSALENRSKDMDKEMLTLRDNQNKSIDIEEKLKTAMSQVSDFMKVREERDFLELRVDTLEQQLKQNSERSAKVNDHYETLVSKYSHLEVSYRDASERLSISSQKVEILTRQLLELQTLSNTDKKLKDDKQRVLEQVQSELMESSVKVQKLQVLCDDLQHDLNSTTTALHSTKNQVAAQVQQETQLLCNQLRNKLETIIGALKEEQSNYNSVNKEIVETLAKELAQTKQEKDILQTALERQQQDYMKYKDQLAQTVSTLKETLDKSQHVEQQYLILQQQYANLESTYLEEKEKLQHEIIQLDQALHQTQVEKNALEAVVDKSWKVAELQEQDKQLLKQTQDTCTRLQEDNIKLQQALARAGQELQLALNKFSDEKEQLSNEIEHFRSKASAYQQEKEDATIESIKLQHLCTELQLQINEAALLSTTIQELKEKLSTSEQERDMSLQASVEQREHDQALIQEMSHSYELLQNEHLKLQEVYTRLTQEIDVLSSRLASEHQTQNTNEQLQNDNIKLQQALVRLDQEMASLVTKFRSEEEYLTKEIDLYRARASDLQHEKEDIAIDNIKLQHLCTELQLQVNSTTTAVSGYLSTIQELQPKIQELENQTHLLEEENHQLKEQLILHQKEIEALQKERDHFVNDVFDDIKKNLLDTKSKLEAGQKDNEELQTSFAVLKVEHEKYSIQLAAVTQENHALKEKLEVYSKKYSTIETENKRLSEELFVASQTLQNLQNILVKAELSIKENDRLSVLLSEVQSQLATSILQREELQLKLSDKDAVIFALGREKEDLKASLQSLYKY